MPTDASLTPHMKGVQSFTNWFVYGKSPGLEPFSNTGRMHMAHMQIFEEVHTETCINSQHNI